VDPDVCDSEHEEKVVDLNSEQRVENMLHSLEIFNAHDFTQNYVPWVNQENVVSVLDSTHEKQKIGYFMYSPFDYHERKSTNHFIQEPVDIPSIFLIDDTAEIFVEPRYDEYDDDYKIVSLGRLVACTSMTNNGFQQSNFYIQCVCFDQSAQDKDTNQLILDSTLLARVLLQRYSADFQPSFQLGLHRREESVEEQIYYDSLGQWHEDIMFPYEDPFAAGLETVSGVKFSDFVKFISKLFFDKTLSRSVNFLLKKNVQGMQQLEKMLAWLHWHFHFT